MIMTDQEIGSSFDELVVDLDDLKAALETRPLLAHYTSIDALEKIMKSGEVWLSNPLFMNDLEEVRFGLQQGARLFLQSQAVTDACQTPERAQLVRDAFAHYYNQFDQDHAFDTYVFCLSEHDPKNTNGVLSMWRAYGGHGRGAALVFNTDLLTAPNPKSPLLLVKVKYGSQDERIEWLSTKLERWCQKLQNLALPDGKLYIAAHAFLYIIRLFALKTKHDGFSEENEWRVIYIPEKDPKIWPDNLQFHYSMGPNGVEPKLRFKVKPLDPNLTWTFSDILDQIILGPSLSSLLARRSVERMLDAIGRSEFRQKVSASQIPLRPSN